jgi:hypothetical protein
MPSPQLSLSKIHSLPAPSERPSIKGLRAVDQVFLTGFENDLRLYLYRGTVHGSPLIMTRC